MEYIASKISDNPHSSSFADISPRAREPKEKINRTTSNSKASEQLKEPFSK